MTSVLAGIDAKVDSRCLTAVLNKQGCEVDAEGSPAPRRVIDMDHPNAPVGRAQEKCDYLLLADESSPRRLLVVPLELKSTGLNPASVQSQLQAGAQAAERIVAGISPIRFVPVAVHGRKIRRRTFRELLAKRIQFRSGEYQIKTMNCGDQLTWALE